MAPRPYENNFRVRLSKTGNCPAIYAISSGPQKGVHMLRCVWLSVVFCFLFCSVLFCSVLRESPGDRNTSTVKWPVHSRQTRPAATHSPLLLTRSYMSIGTCGGGGCTQTGFFFPPRSVAACLPQWSASTSGQAHKQVFFSGSGIGPCYL